MATAKLSRNLPANQNSLHKWTYSGWVKRCDLGAEIYMFNFYDDANNRGGFRFNTDDTLLYYDRVGGSTVCNKVTNRVFRDTAAWYHVMVAVDKSVSSPDTKIYVNGVEETSFSTDNDYSQNQSTKINDNDTLYINSYDGSSDIKSQIQTHVHWVSGYTLTPATFGETDSTSGIWKPKTAPSVTYGTNGFFLKFENSAAMGTDSSGNSNNFTVSGTLTQNVDTPSNNFCTFNGVNPYSGTLSNGNLKMSQASYDYNVQGTLGMESGKYYWEYKIDGLYGEFGVCEQGKAGQSDPQANIGFYFLYNNGNTTGYIWNNATAGSQSTEITIPAFASGMIINLAYDADNKALYIGQNGTWLNSGDPTSGASKTGALITNLYPRFGGTIVPFCGHGTSNTTANYEANFGQGYFGTTAVASAGTAPSEGGIFEYNCPSGYQALCTKGINSF